MEVKSYKWHFFSLWYPLRVLGIRGRISNRETAQMMVRMGWTGWGW